MTVLFNSRKNEIIKACIYLLIPNTAVISLKPNQTNTQRTKEKTRVKGTRSFVKEADNEHELAGIKMLTVPSARTCKLGYFLH